MTEAELLQLARTGDQRAFRQLFVSHERRLWAVCLRITGNHHDAEDALAGTVYLAWKNLPKFRGDSGFGTWCYRIASNAALEIVRSRKAVVPLDGGQNGGQNSGGDDLGVPALQLGDPAAPFDQRVADTDALSRALGELGEQAREAIVLKEIAGLPVAEIARHQNSSLSATKVRLHRARAALQELLQ